MTTFVVTFLEFIGDAFLILWYSNQPRVHFEESGIGKINKMEKMGSGGKKK